MLCASWMLWRGASNLNRPQEQAMHLHLQYIMYLLSMGVCLPRAPICCTLQASLSGCQCGTPTLTCSTLGCQSTAHPVCLGSLKRKSHSTRMSETPPPRAPCSVSCPVPRSEPPQPSPPLLCRFSSAVGLTSYPPPMLTQGDNLP